MNRKSILGSKEVLLLSAPTARVSVVQSFLEEVVYS